VVRDARQVIGHLSKVARLSRGGVGERRLEVGDREAGVRADLPALQLAFGVRLQLGHRRHDDLEPLLL